MIASRSRPDDVALERAHRGHAQLVAAAVGEGEAVPFEARLVGAQDDVGGGVVALVHGVGAVAVARGREADVADGDAR